MPLQRHHVQFGHIPLNLPIVQLTEVASADRRKRFFYGAEVSFLEQDRCKLAAGLTHVDWSNL